MQKLNSDFDSTIGSILSKLTNRYEKVIFIADLASLFYERLQLLRN